MLIRVRASDCCGLCRQRQRVASGKLLWQWDLPEPTVSEPAVSPDGTVVYWATNATGNAGGHVWAAVVTWHMLAQQIQQQVRPVTHASKATVPLTYL